MVGSLVVIVAWLICGVARTALSAGCEYPAHAVQSFANVLFLGGICQEPPPPNFP
jgi:hypothetical protein